LAKEYSEKANSERSEGVPIFNRDSDGEVGAKLRDQRREGINLVSSGVRLSCSVCRAADNASKTLWVARLFGIWAVRNN